MNKDLISRAEAHLIKSDSYLGQLISSQKLEPLELRGGYFESLCRSIIGQQVSVAAATAIYLRFEKHTKLLPSNVARMDENTSKSIGLSRQKLSYLKDLAAHFVTDPEVYNHLESQSDEAIIAELTAVKGIGVWTAQMFLIFTLARPDVFAPDDVGLQRAMMQIYGWSELPAKKELEQAAIKWQPYRTIASLHLWQSLSAKAK